MANLDVLAGFGKIHGTLSKTTVVTSKGTFTRSRKLIWADVKAELKKGESNAEV